MQPLKPPRLWMRKPRVTRDGVPHRGVWMILDRGRHIATGAVEGESAAAEEAFRNYVAAHYPNGFGVSRDPLDVLSPENPGDPVVYFVTSDDVQDHPIKIGFSRRDVQMRRLQQLNRGFPYELHVLATIKVAGLSDERAWHERFAHLRLRGEWFKRDESLLKAIRESIESLAH
jgi:hypothetical protein